MPETKEEAKTVEVTVAELTTHKDKVFFPGTANLSEKEAGMFKTKQEAAAAAKTAAPEAKTTAQKKTEK